jgi:hypothetical protein
MVRQFILQTVSGKPSDCQMYLCFAHQLPVMDYPMKKPGKHQSHRCFRVDPWTSVIFTVTLSHFFP